MTHRYLSLRWTGCLLLAAAFSCRAEVDELRIAQQYGLQYLPLIVMQDRGLIEKHASAQGLPALRVDWVKFSGSNVMIDGVLSGTLHVASGGFPGLALVWSKTRENLDVRGAAAMCSMPTYLNTRNAGVRTVADFTAKDRIALPAIKSSPQAVLLQMAAEKAYGPGQQARLDSLTVSMGHPDATIALLSGSGGVTAHFSTSPFHEQELADANIHTVISSDDVLGGPSTLTVVWTTSKFRAANPKVYEAFVHALEESMVMIARDPRSAAESYLRIAKSRESVEDIMRMLENPRVAYTTTPQNVMKFAEFMYRVGTIKVRPQSWKDFFFPNVHALAGS